MFSIPACHRKPVDAYQDHVLCMRKKTIIIDDERLARMELRRLLAEYPEIDVVAETSCKDEGLQMIRNYMPDLIFLDIHMPGKTVFEMFSELEVVPQVIFTTAQDSYSQKALHVHALDYLLKPIDPARLSKAIQKLDREEEDLEALPGSVRMRLSEHDQIFVKDGDKCWFVRLSDVRYFESVGNYTRLHFGSNRPLILKSLNALGERLDERAFFRANRKHIVNLRMVERIDTHINGGLTLMFSGGEKFEVSRRQAVRFKELMSL